MTVTTSGVAVADVLVLDEPDEEEEDELEEEVVVELRVAEGAASPGGKVDTLGMVVDPEATDDAAEPAKAAKPTAGGSKR